MNEEQKNIETCLPENILSEVANVPTDPQFVSLTDEALDPLKQQALRQAGYDGYKEVVMYHQPYTFTSSVKQMKSNLILLLRRLWRFPFGRGTTASSDAGSASAGSAAGSSAASAAAPIRSLADMWQHYITRLKGNPEYGIPSRLSSLTDLPAAPALLADRDMSSGIRFGTNPLPDGMSLAQLLCGSAVADKVTEIVDSNTGWVMTRTGYIDTLKSMFPNLLNITLNCRTSVKLINNPAVSINQPNLPELETTALPGETFINGLEEWYLPKLKAFTGGMNASDAQLANLKKMNFPEMESIGEGVSYPDFFYEKSFPNLEEMYFPSLKRIKTWRTARTLDVAGETTKFWRLVLGKLEYLNDWKGGVQKVGLIQSADLNLIDVEIGAGTAISFSLEGWKPTNVLADADKTATFLQNFRDHIAERLTDNGTGLTITLSQEVRNAIHAAEDEYGIENIIITQKGWTISPAPN